MNLKLVLRTYSALRQLTDDETALLETLRGMTDAERELTVETLSPQVKPTKKAGKKAAGKSRRAASLANQIQARALDGGVSKMRCDALVDDNGGEMLCGQYADHNIHHLATAAGYHEFTAAKDGNYEAQVVGGD